MACNKSEERIVAWQIEKESNGSIKIYKTNKGSDTALHLSPATVQKVVDVDKLLIREAAEKGNLETWRHDLGGLAFPSIYEFKPANSWYIDIRKWFVNTSCQIRPTTQGLCLSLQDWSHFAADLRLTISQATPSDKAYNTAATKYCTLLNSPMYATTLDFLVGQMSKIQRCAACDNNEPGQEGHSCLDEKHTLQHEPAWNRILKDFMIQKAYSDVIGKLLTESGSVPQDLTSILMCAMNLPDYMSENEARLRYDMIQAGFSMDVEKANNHEPVLPPIHQQHL